MMSESDIVQASRSIQDGLCSLLQNLDSQVENFPETYDDLLYFFPLRADACPYCILMKRTPGFQCIPDCEFAMSHGAKDCDDVDSVWWRLAIRSVSWDTYHDITIDDVTKSKLRELCKCGFPLCTDIEQFMVAKKQLLKNMIEFFPENEEFLEALEEY